MLKIKSILFVAGTVFMFSFFTGLLSGNPFSVILFRSLTGTVIFTLIISAAVIIIKKTLPELSDIIPEEGEQISSEDIPGGNIDIVIEDENPYIRDEAEDDDDGENIDEEKLLQKDFIEEVEEESIDDIGILKNVDDSEEVIEVMDDSMNSNSLPELDENASFFSGSSDSTIGGDNDALNKLGGNVDPGTMAKAIKTILKRDQEG